MRQYSFQCGFLNGVRCESRTGREAGSFSGRFVDRCLGFTPDDSGVLVWRPGTGLAVVRMEDRSERPFVIQPAVRAAVRFSRDGGTMYTVEGPPEGSTVQGTLRVWDVKSRLQTKSLGFGFGVVDFALSPSGKHIAAAGGDRTVRVYDLESGGELTRLPQAAPVIRVVFYGGDENLLVIDEQSIRIQPWREADLLRNICRRVSRNLTPDEWNHYSLNWPYFKACPLLP